MAKLLRIILVNLQSTSQKNRLNFDFVKLHKNFGQPASENLGNFGIISKKCLEWKANFKIKSIIGSIEAT